MSEQTTPSAITPEVLERAATIVTQLGGVPFLRRYIGATFFKAVAPEYTEAEKHRGGVGIRYTSRGRNGNHIEVLVDYKDTYTLKFWRCSVLGAKLRQTVEGVYVEQLKETIYNTTGLSLNALKIRSI